MSANVLLVKDREAKGKVTKSVRAFGWSYTLLNKTDN